METNEKSRVLDMTRGNPFRLVLKFALPLFFGNLLQQFYEQWTGIVFKPQLWSRG